MYQIIETDFGSRVMFANVLTEEEALRFAADALRLRTERPGPRSVILDIRTLVPPEPKVLEILTEALRRSAESGLERAAIVVNSPVIRGQAIQIGFLTDAVNIARFIDAGKFDNWEEMSLDWVVKGIEPDVVIAPHMRLP